MSLYINPNAKSVFQLKKECHKLMVNIFGGGKDGNARSYAYLKKRYGREIHFADIEDIELLTKIKDELWTRSFKGNFFKTFM